MDQIAVGTVQLDAVETGLDRVAGRGDEVPDGRLDLFGGQLARDDVVLGTVVQIDLTGRGDGRGTDRDQAVGQQVRVADPAAVHDLGDDLPALGVYGVGDLAPGGYLLLAVQPGGVRVALADHGGLRPLGDDQPRRSPLRVVLGRRVGGRVARAEGTAAGHRRERDAVAELRTGEIDRVERGGHEGS